MPDSVASEKLTEVLRHLAGPQAVPRADQLAAVDAVLQPAARVRVVQATAGVKVRFTGLRHARCAKRAAEQHCRLSNAGSHARSSGCCWKGGGFGPKLSTAQTSMKTNSCCWRRRSRSAFANVSLSGQMRFANLQVLRMLTSTDFCRIWQRKSSGGESVCS